MVILQAIILGIIEGLTEFLPISSTGHLVVAERAMGYKDAAELFTVVIQVGAIAAVIWHYRYDLWEKVRDLFSGDKAAIRFWKVWVLATIPAGMAGLLLDKKLSDWATPKTVAISLILGGIMIWAIEHYHKPKPARAEPQFEKLTIKQSLQIGCYQILSLIPGVSRSGATIMGGLLSGLDRVTATAFSFFLSIPILVLATAFKLAKDGDKVSQVSGGTTALVIGTIVAFLSALMVVNWLLHYVAKHNFKPFAYYRIGLGIIILAILAIR
jgi:undecaprenyl-diphosphatase